MIRISGTILAAGTALSLALAGAAQA